MSVSDTWCSPPEIGEPLEQFFQGPVDVDPCSNERSVIKALVAYTTGGLILPWRRHVPGTCYENFPYSQGQPWTDKMLNELATGNVTEHIRLSMMATSTKWWSDMCLLPRLVPRVLGLKRLKFLDPRPGKADDRVVCRFEPALTYIGHRPERFTREFDHLTMWATWGR